MKWTRTDEARPCFTSITADFLGHLDPCDRAKLEPCLERALVSRGLILLTASDTGEYVYFPQGPLISLEQSNKVEVALIGSEGIVGWPALVGCKCSPFRAIVRGRDGIILKIRTDVLMAIASASPSLGLVLNGFVNVINVQMAETIGAYAFHRIEMRLARWLLLRHDRMGGDELLVHHDEIAENLGARRASITDCLHVIEGNGLVRCRRGRIIVRDRCGLELLAAGCYGAAESFYREIIGQFGKPAAAAAGFADGSVLGEKGHACPAPNSASLFQGWRS